MVLLVLPALAAPELDSQATALPPMDKGAVEADGASLVLLYSGEQRGEIGPCGCDSSPKGGLGRTLTMVEARQRAQPDTPMVLLNAGAWLSSQLGVGALSERARLDNEWFHQAVEEVPFDVLHVTPREIPSLLPRAGLVSASHRLPAGSVQVEPYVVVERGGLSVAITGVSQDTLTYLQPSGTQALPPVQAVQDLLPELQQHDIVVVMVYDLPQEARAIAALPGVDVVIEGGGYKERWPAQLVGDAIWVRSRDEGASLGELRLWLEDGEVVRAADRILRLPSEIPSDKRLDRLEQRQDKAVLKHVRSL
jgi:hypothetical protein